MEIGKRVRQLREAQGLSLRALARLSSMTPSGISLVEQGKSAPSSTTVEKLAQALGVEPGVLFGSIPKAPPPKTIAELLDVARVEGRELERPHDRIGELFEGLSYEETIALAWRIVHARRAVKAVIDRYKKDPDTTPEEIRVLDGLEIRTFLVNSIAIATAHGATEAEAARAKAEGDAAQAEAAERDGGHLVAQGRV